MSMPSHIGSSPIFMAMLDHISRIAPVARPVLIWGERGAGKELAAARLHYLSGRWDGPYVTLNCAALSPTLLDAELFGAEQGAYTGSNKRRQGRFERADGGTLFLDEIATASLETQEKLLRAIEYGQFERVGGERPLKADVRIVAATNADLPKAVLNGTFRADLLDRLTFDVVHVPPLRYRGEDIVELAQQFMNEMAAECGWSTRPALATTAREDLLSHDWPGNVRELRNVCERAVAEATIDNPIEHIRLNVFEPPWTQQTTALKLVSDIQTTQTTYDFKARLDATARTWLLDAMTAHDHNQTDAAKALGLSYFQLRHLLSKHDLLPQRSSNLT